MEHKIPHPWEFEARRALVETLAREQDFRCLYCGLKVELPGNTTCVRGTNLATIEHLVPTSLGGCDCEINLRCACKKCNSLRGDKNFFLVKTVFDELMQGRAIEEWHQLIVNELPSIKIQRKRLTKEVAKRIANIAYVPQLV